MVRVILRYHDRVLHPQPAKVGHSVEAPLGEAKLGSYPRNQIRTLVQVEFASLVGLKAETSQLLKSHYR